MTEFNCLFKSEKGLDLCNKILTVEYKPEWHRGGTGYIDGVRPTDSVFSENSIVKFVDTYDRSAISFKYQVNCPDAEVNYKEYAVTAFQRYTNHKDLWVFGGHFAAPDLTTQPGTFNHTWLENLLITSTETTEICDLSPNRDHLLCATCDLILGTNTAESSTNPDAA
jgi:hypothetical protein